MNVIETIKKLYSKFPKLTVEELIDILESYVEETKYSIALPKTGINQEPWTQTLYNNNTVTTDTRSYN